MTKKRRIATREWEKLIWRPFGRFFKLILFLVVSLVSSAFSLIVIGVEILLGIIWFLSLGHLDWLKPWNAYLDTTIRPVLISRVGKMLINLLGGWG